MTTLRRRLITVPGVMLAAAALLALLPLWLPVLVVVDLVRRCWRMPLLRLGLFGLCWAWLETAGVVMASALWCAGQRRNRRAHYRLQAWWAASLMAALQMTTGVKVFHRVDSLAPGPAVLLARHASLADSLVSAWAVTSVARLRPRYVLKRELLWDPCLDIVGHRLPNHFLDRGAVDSAPELAAVREVAADLGPRDVAVIFPEGTRASPTKRARALAAIAASSPDRAARLGALQHLLPPRPAGTLAMLGGAPEADVVLGWHSGLDGLDTFAGIIAHLAHRPPPVRFATRRVARDDVPVDPVEQMRWLDDRWLELDRATHDLIEFDRTHARPTKEWL